MDTEKTAHSIVLKPCHHKSHRWENAGLIVTNNVTTKVQTCLKCKCEKRTSFDKLTRSFIAVFYYLGVPDKPGHGKELRHAPACITYENLLF
jgi:hypothetical protein